MLVDDALQGTPYDIVRQIGRGAASSVFLVRHRELGRHLVVKVLRERYAKVSDALDRLRLEARALAQLSEASPHLVEVIDIGTTAAGRPYIVMPALEGESLGDAIRRRGALEPAVAVDLAVQLLRGLEVAHQAGLVHRDIKPDNIFLARSGQSITVKLLDFGIAKVIDVASPIGGRSFQTTEGVVVGSPHYFSPEQVTGLPIDARADLYAAGLVLWHMLTAQRPFQEAAPSDQPFERRLLSLMRASQAAVLPPASTIARGVPASLDSVIARAVAKDPTARFQTARELIDALAAVTRRASVHGTEPLTAGPAAQAAEEAPPVAPPVEVPRAAAPRGPLTAEPRRATRRQHRIRRSGRGWRSWMAAALAGALVAMLGLAFLYWGGVR